MFGTLNYCFCIRPFRIKGGLRRKVGIDLTTERAYHHLSTDAWVLKHQIARINAFASLSESSNQETKIFLLFAAT